MVLFGVQFELEKVAVTPVVLDLFDFRIVEVVVVLLRRGILSERIVNEEDPSLTKNHEFLVTFELDHGHEVGCLPNKFLESFYHRLANLRRHLS